MQNINRFVIVCSIQIVFRKFNFQIYSEAVVQRCSVKKVFLEISQNSLENTCQRLFYKRLWQRYFSENFAKFLRTFFYRTPVMAALVYFNPLMPNVPNWSDTLVQM